MVRAEVTAASRAFYKEPGNDVTTVVAVPGLKGLKRGSRWCLCASHRVAAVEADRAPRRLVSATHEPVFKHAPGDMGK